MGVLLGCKPRAEVLQGDLADAIFAADFGDVIADRGPAVYRDPRPFFRNTHPAAPLRTLVEKVFGRLADPKDVGVTIRLSTGFGGGKTHTLIALYHLARHVGDPTLGTELLPAAGRPSHVHVVAVDAQKGGVPVFSVHEGQQIRSLWGEVFYQLGACQGDGPAALAALGAADDPERSPSDGQLEAVLPPGPLLFLLDELVIYMARLSERGQGNILGFVGTLMAVAAKRPQTALLVTDPAGQHAYQRQSAQLASALAAGAAKLDSIFGRKVSDFNPIEGEAARVIARRLLDEVDSGAAQRASATYHELYQRVAAAEPGSLPPAATTLEYARRFVECYPFHPRLLETAQDRLGALDDFQRSRGVLRLFARILRDVWEQRLDPEVISAGELTWSSPRIRADLLQRLNRDSFRAVADADVDRHAGELDGGAPRGVHRRVASALLLESLPLQTNTGMDRADVTLAVLRPDEAGPEPGEALDRLTGVCWHTYPLPGGRAWQFRIEPNVIKQVEERMARISREDATSRVRLEARQYFSGPQFKLAAWPASPRQVADTAGLQLALCDDESLARRVCDYADDEDPQAPMPRGFRNAIVAVAPTPAAFAEAVERAQRLLAVEEIEKELHRGEGNRVAREQLARHKPEYARQFRLQTIRAFDRVVRAGASPKTIPEPIQSDDDQVLKQQSGQSVLLAFLEANRLVYKPTDELDTALFAGSVLAGATPVSGELDVYTAKAVYERFLGAPGLRLVRDSGTVRRTIVKAVQAGQVVVRLADGRAYDAAGCVSGPESRRQRSRDQLESLALDDSVRLTRAGSAAAARWTQVAGEQPAPKPDPGGRTIGDGSGGYITPPPPPPPQVSVTDPARLAEYAATRPLISLELTAHTPTAAGELSRSTQPLTAVSPSTSLSWDVAVSGTDRDGCFIAFQASGVRPSHPAKPLETAGLVCRAVGADAQYSAVLKLRFGDGGQSGLVDALATLAGQLPAGVAVLAEFGLPR